MNLVTNEENRWQWKKLLFCQVISLLLISSLFIPLINSAWQQIDLYIFQKTNQSFQGNKIWKNFWALLNHRSIDFIEDLLMITFYIFAIFSTPKELRFKRFCQLIFCVLFITFTIICINRLFFLDYLRMRRDSPTLVFDNSIRLSDEITWIKIKDHSAKSFPGDHATMILLFGLTLARFSSFPINFFAILYAIFRCLPRLMVGAHWFSDIIVGSGAIILFSFGWAFYSPFQYKMTYWIERLIQPIYKTLVRVSPWKR
ncbi:MAG: phosphatase PAP2 family protein [Chlamydiae bacterium]|nr:phosphatase PAP2 family protein [Chlamydiota bacterium]